jgi:hypothetical protein
MDKVMPINTLGANTAPPILNTFVPLPKEGALRAYNPLSYACLRTHGKRINAVKAAEKNEIRIYGK